MNRRSAALSLDVLSVLVGALLGLATNYATQGDPPRALQLLSDASLPLVGVSVVLLLGLRYWQSRLDRPPEPKRDWDPTRSPYPGLHPFTEEETAAFFGRDPEIQILLDRLDPAVPGLARQRFVPVTGPSGSGKSSLVQGGLLPRLAKRRPRWVLLPPFVPGTEPVRRLEFSIGEALDRGAGPVMIPTDDSAALVRWLERVRAAQGGRSSPLILVVDQAEELVNQSPEADMKGFLALLKDAMERAPWLWTIVVLRSEFLTRFLQSDFAELFQQPVAVGPLSRAALLEVIQRPAEQAEVQFDPPQLVQQMVDDTGRGEALPLLAYTLNQLWERAGPKKRVITRQAYNQLGGVGGALARRADRLTEQLEATEPGTRVLDTLMKFIMVEGTTPTRRRVPRASLDETEQRIADAFIAARLLTSDTDPVTGASTIHVAHEALFERWQSLRQLVEARQAELQLRAKLERWALEWANAGRSADYLLTGERLHAAQQWAKADPSFMADLPLVREYLDTSVHADHATMERLANTAATRGFEMLGRDAELALLVARSAAREYTPTPMIYQLLLAALAVYPVRGVLRGHGQAVFGVAWSPDGARLAAGCGDGAVRVWELARGGEPAVLVGHEEAVFGVAWSADGTRLASASQDWTGRIWNPSDGSELRALQGHDQVVLGVCWSPDDARLATGSRDRTVRMWDAARGLQLAVFHGHQGAVSQVAWSPDGARLASASDDETVRVWSTDLTVLRGHENTTRAVEWSPDGSRLASVSHDTTVRVWDARRGVERAVLRGHQAGVTCIAWSPDGSRLASVSHDTTVRVWDARRAVERCVLRGHQAILTWVTWSPNNPWVASASIDRTLRIWDVARRTEIGVFEYPTGVTWASWSPNGARLAVASLDWTVRILDGQHRHESAVLRGHKGEIWGAAWSPDGSRLASASYDGTVRLWDPERGVELTALHGHDDAVFNVRWSPDGSELASVGRDRTIRVWDVATVVERALLRGHEDAIWGLAWSPDGARLATASDDRSVRLWDAVVDLDAALAKADGAAVRQLTEDERQRFMLPEEPLARPAARDREIARPSAASPA